MTESRGPKVFRDPIHQLIALDRSPLGHPDEPESFGDSLLLALIDSPEMQRLRRIRQLGPANRIYPAAEHSRFSHSLGVMHLARRILGLLLHQDPALFTPLEVVAVKCCALLHDVGHGPYSHTFEHVLPDAPRHENWGWSLLSGETALGARLRDLPPESALDPDRLRDTMAGVWGLRPPRGGEGVGRQIIASQLDADRLDYLLRDAHFTGVGYGLFDLEWLLHSLKVGEIAGEKRLCVDIDRGPAALESYIAARDNMYRQVYDHKTVRAFECLILHLFKAVGRVREELGHWPTGTPPALERYLENPDIPAFLALDDAVVEYATGYWAGLDPETAAPAMAELIWKSGLLRHRQPLYRRMRWQCEQGVPSDIIVEAQAVEALDTFCRSQADTLLEAPLPGKPQHRAPLRLLATLDRVDRAPYAHLQYASDGHAPIYALCGGEVKPAEEVSPLIHFLGQNRRQWARLFVDPRAMPALAALLRRESPHPALCPHQP
ncbi:MAG: HD domain-containing protein [Magnetococcales bacterium]|nr:HD domain-containing protein [Magnetococcales bacterium]